MEGVVVPGVQARSQGGANGCNCTLPLDVRSAQLAMNFIINMSLLFSVIYTYSERTASCISR